MAIEVALPTVMDEYSPSPYLCQYELSLVLLSLAILKDVNWYLKIFLICISLVANEEHFF